MNDQTEAHPITESERQKAKAIAKAIGGSKARAARLEVSILAVLATFGGTITHVEHPQPVAYAPGDYTQDPDTLSAQPACSLPTFGRAGR